MKEIAIEATTFTPTVLLTIGLLINGAALFTMIGMMFGLSRKVASMSESLVEFEADTRADTRIIAEVLRCYFFQHARPRESELAAIGLRREDEEDR